MGFRVEDLSDEQLLKLAARISEALADKEPSEWSEDARTWAEENDIIAGDENGRKQYKKFCTREELIQILYNKEH